MPRGLSARQFAIALDQFNAKTEEQARIVFRKIALDLDSRIVLATPVDTGRARGNWFPSLNAPASGVTNDVDPSGSKALSALNSVVAGAQLGDLIWMTNNLPYILPLENGHSKQAPQGMVDVNLNAIAQTYGGQIVR